MKRIIFFLLLISPVFAYAENVMRYGTAADCKENVAANGTFQYPSDIALNDNEDPKIQILVDPDFNAKMNRERFTPDLPVTPIYDLVVQTIPAFASCYTDTPEKFSTEPPKTIPFTASIELASKALISVSSLSWNGKRDEIGQPIYEWKINGWPNGIVSESKMERLIRAVHDHDSSLKLVVQAKFPDGRSIRAEKGTGFTFCAPVWGSGTHEVVYDRVAHRLSDFIYQSDGIITQAFLKVDPFKAYSKEFLHLFNLNNYQGKSWFNIHKAAQEGRLSIAQDCGGDQAIHISISPLVPLEDFASAISAPSRFIQIASDVTKRALDFNARNLPGQYFFTIPFPLIALHEFGHAFAGLNDEYISGQIRGKNCSTNPSTDWSSNGLRYGDTSFEGCGFPISYHRPSQASIMRGAQSGEMRFNVVSCGYIVAAIKGEGEGPKYFKECMNPEWNTIKPGGKTASLGNIFASLFHAFSRNKNLSSVGSAVENGQEILVEHISSDGTFTDEVLSVPSISYEPLPLADIDTSGNADTSSPPSVPQSPQACGDANGDGKVTTLDIALMRKHILGLGLLDPDGIDRADINRDGMVSTLDIALLRRKILGDGSFPFSCSAIPFDLDASSFEDLNTNNQSSSSNLNDVSTETIFDTVSVDLKVNGQDGPITVGKRDRVVLSWVSGGATRCRGVWSKNDIKLSGTASGRITRPVTIKIACIDGEGNRADDAVTVTVVN